MLFLFIYCVLVCNVSFGQFPEREETLKMCVSPPPALSGLCISTFLKKLMIIPVGRQVGYWHCRESVVYHEAGWSRIVHWQPEDQDRPFWEIHSTSVLFHLKFPCETLGKQIFVQESRRVSLAICPPRITNGIAF